MHNGSRASGLECVLVDLNTQFDFINDGGRRPVLNHRELYLNLRRMIAWAKRNQAPVVSSVFAEPPDRPGNGSLPKNKAPRTQTNPACSRRRNQPAKNDKLPFTLFDNRVLVVGDNMLSVPIDLLTRYQQDMFPLFGDDFFANPKADRFVTTLHAHVFVVFGTSAERAVKSTVLGLLARNKNVLVLKDACGFWNPIERELACRQMAAKGAAMATVDEWTTRRLSRRRTTQTQILLEPDGQHVITRPTRHGLVIPAATKLTRNNRRPRPFST